MARLQVLLAAEEVHLSLARARGPHSISRENIAHILSFCGRHWFDRLTRREVEQGKDGPLHDTTRDQMYENM